MRKGKLTIIPSILGTGFTTFQYSWKSGEDHHVAEYQMPLKGTTDEMVYHLTQFAQFLREKTESAYR